jgi:tetratricopeptide (TPR) repeat protein
MEDKFKNIHKNIEKELANLEDIMKSKQFKTKEEAQKFLNSLIGKKIPEINMHKSPERLAQDLIYDAFEKTNKNEICQLAHKALEIYPDCADAYCLLADYEAKNDEEALELYLKGEKAGRKTLGEDFIKENSGELWGCISARPYMRAMSGVVEYLWRRGRRDEAIKKCYEMLELNRNDNQGMRYLLCYYLCAEKRLKEADELMNKGIYNDDYGIVWFYNRPIVEFSLNGDTKKARNLVYEALKRNLFVLLLMSGLIKMPSETSGRFIIKSIDEAIFYLDLHLDLWLKEEKRLLWFIDTSSDLLLKHKDEIKIEFKSEDDD